MLINVEDDSYVIDLLYEDIGVNSKSLSPDCVSANWINIKGESWTALSSKAKNVTTK